MTVSDHTVDIGSIDRSAEETAIWKLSGVVITAYILLPLSYWLLLAFDPNFIRFLVNEDGLVETFAAVFFLSASFMLFFLYYKSAQTPNKYFGVPTKRNFHILLLAVFFFFCFGEEISWGQRLFQWSTPKIWGEMNYQNETNLHNLWVFKGVYPDGTEKSFLEKLTNESRLLSMFWLAYCVIIPIIYTFGGRLRTFLTFIGLPIPSLVIGGLFVVNYISYRLATATIDVEVYHAFIELKETNNAAIFSILALYFICRHNFVAQHLIETNLQKNSFRQPRDYTR